MKGQWIQNAFQMSKKPMPVLSFPGIQLLNTEVDKLVASSELQADCMRAIAGRYDMMAAVSLMDLSVEAEAFGSEVRYSGDEVPTVVGRIIETAEDAENLTVPAVGAGRTGACIDAIAKASRDITDRPVLAGVIGPFSLAGRMVDMTEVMCLCAEDPDMVHTVLRKVTRFITSYISALKQAGASGVVIAEPAAGLLSPLMNKEFSVPYMQEIVAALQDDRFAVVYHNCGPYTIRQIDDLLAIGAKILHFGNAIDMGEMAKHIPDSQLFSGNVAPAEVFRYGTPDMVRDATRALMEQCGELPNFIPSSGCDIPPVSPLENIDAFFETVEAYYAEQQDTDLIDQAG